MNDGRTNEYINNKSPGISNSLKSEVRYDPRLSCTQASLAKLRPGYLKDFFVKVDFHFNDLGRKKYTQNKILISSSFSKLREGKKRETLFSY